MRETFLYTLNAILPLACIILLGYFVKRTGQWSDSLFLGINRLCFRLFLPILLFVNVYSIEDLSVMNWRSLLYCIFSIAFGMLVGFLAAYLFVPDRQQKPVIIQASLRSNQAILGLSLVASLAGEAALPFASLVTSLSIPFFNIFSIAVLSYYSSGDSSQRYHKLVHSILTNPMTIATLLGLALVFIRQFLPTVDSVPIFTIRTHLPFIYQALSNMSKITSPLMLFVLGTRLDFKATANLLPQLVLGTTLRLIICPLCVIGGAVLFQEQLGFTTLEMPTLLTLSASPVAIVSAVMTQEIGGDSQLASQLVVWTSMFSMFTIFCFVYVLRFFGYI